MQITTAHFENAASALGDLDVGLLLSAQARLAPKVANPEDPEAPAPSSALDPEAIKDFLAVLAQGGKTKAFRRLAALANASVDEVLEAEAAPAKMAALEIIQAKRPFLEAFQDAVVFFSALVPMPSSTPASSQSPAEGEVAAEPKAPESTPSAAS